MPVKQYDPRDVIITWGPIIIEGVADGTFVAIEFDEDAATKHVGAQGDVTVTISANRGAGAMITLGQASPSNDKLSAAAALQRRRGNGLVKMPFTVKHINGTTLASTPEAWIKKEPAVEFGQEHSNREWALDIGELTLAVGGSLR
jgi:hypothetical protein